LCEFGYETIYPENVENNNWIDKPYKMVQAHFQGFTVPPNCTELATGSRFAHQAFHYQERAFGFQFHPEVSQTMFSEWQRADWAHEFYNASGAQPVLKPTATTNATTRYKNNGFAVCLIGFLLQVEP